MDPVASAVVRARVGDTQAFDELDRQHAGIPHSVKPRGRHRRRQPAEQRQRIEVDGVCAVAEGLLEFDADEPVGKPRRPL